MPRVRATQERQWEQAGGVIYDVPEAEDGAGNTIEGELVGDGVQGVLFLRILQADTGVLLDSIEVVPDRDMKADSAHIWVRQIRGRPAVRVRFGNHMAGPQTPEVLSKDRYDWFSPHLVPIQVGEVKMGRDGAVPIEEGQQTCNCPTLAEIVNAVLNVITEAFGGNIRQGLEDKAKDALRESMDGERGDPVVYGQLRNTSYSGALDALIAYFGTVPRRAGIEADALELTMQQRQEAMDADMRELSGERPHHAPPVRGEK
jgi:hypothetical protein